MRIHVTREDIENGRVRDAQNCPVAVALRRAGIAHCGVSGMRVWVASGHRAVVLPGPVQEWILNYDYGMQMTPIEFELHLPDAEQIPVPERQVATVPASGRQMARRITARPVPLLASARGCRHEQAKELEPVGK